MIQSTPASPYDQRRLPTSSDMNGLAESLIGGVRHITNVGSKYIKLHLLIHLLPGTRR